MGWIEAARSSAAGARRWSLVALAVIGLGLAAAPVIFQMFDRAPRGAEMMQAFTPFMTDARLNGFQRHIRDIDAGVREADRAVAASLEGPGAAAHTRFDRRFPGGDVASLDGLRGYVTGLALTDALRSGT